jgi:RimJ/RimL family protein N-acetyltransferase
MYGPLVTNRYGFPRLETERLLLRPPLAADASAAAELLGDPEVMRFLGGRTVPPEHAPAIVAKWVERWEQNGMGPFLIERREDRCFVGRTGILVWDARTWRHATLADAGRHAQPELGWALARAHWGNGYATEAARAVRSWARSERAVDRLVSLIVADNVASQHVARRLGAVPAETVRLFDSGDAVVWVHPADESAGVP